MYLFYPFAGSKLSKKLLLQPLYKGRMRSSSSIGNPPDILTKPQFKIPEGVVGQPTCYTHPHLIQEGHLTCGITQQEYKDRRDILVKKLEAIPEHSHKSHIVSYEYM